MDGQLGREPKDDTVSNNGLIESWKNLDTSLGEEEDKALILLRLKRKQREDYSKDEFHSMPRSARRFFDHERASICILKDYLGPSSLFDRTEFRIMFLISRPQFEYIAQQLVNHKPHWKQMADAYGIKGPCTAARILLPLHCIGYGVPQHTFCNYFQMSPTAAKLCFNCFITS